MSRKNTRFYHLGSSYWTFVTHFHDLTLHPRSGVPKAGHSLNFSYRIPLFKTPPFFTFPNNWLAFQLSNHQHLRKEVSVICCFDIFYPLHCFPFYRSSRGRKKESFSSIFHMSPNPNLLNNFLNHTMPDSRIISDNKHPFA